MTAPSGPLQLLEGVPGISSSVGAAVIFLIKPTPARPQKRA